MENQTQEQLAKQKLAESNANQALDKLTISNQLYKESTSINIPTINDSSITNTPVIDDPYNLGIVPNEEGNIFTTKQKVELGYQLSNSIEKLETTNRLREQALNQKEQMDLDNQLTAHIRNQLKSPVDEITERLSPNYNSAEAIKKSIIDQDNAITKLLNTQDSIKNQYDKQRLDLQTNLEIAKETARIELSQFDKQIARENQKNRVFNQLYSTHIMSYDEALEAVTQRLSTDKNIGTYSTGFSSAIVNGTISFIDSLANVVYFGDNPQGWNFERYFVDDYRSSYTDPKLVGDFWDKFSTMGGLEAVVYSLPEMATLVGPAGMIKGAKALKTLSNTAKISGLSPTQIAQLENASKLMLLGGTVITSVDLQRRSTDLAMSRAEATNTALDRTGMDYLAGAAHLGLDYAGLALGLTAGKQVSKLVDKIPSSVRYSNPGKVTKGMAALGLGAVEEGITEIPQSYIEYQATKDYKGLSPLEVLTSDTQEAKDLREELGYAGVVGALGGTVFAGTGMAVSGTKSLTQNVKASRAPKVDDITKTETINTTQFKKFVNDNLGNLTNDIHSKAREINPDVNINDVSSGMTELSKAVSSRLIKHSEQVKGISEGDKKKLKNIKADLEKRLKEDPNNEEVKRQLDSVNEFFNDEYIAQAVVNIPNKYPELLPYLASNNKLSELTNLVNTAKSYKDFVDKLLPLMYESGITEQSIRDKFAEKFMPKEEIKTEEESIEDDTFSLDNEEELTTQRKEDFKQPKKGKGFRRNQLNDIDLQNIENPKDLTPEQQAELDAINKEYGDIPKNRPFSEYFQKNPLYTIKDNKKAYSKVVDEILEDINSRNLDLETKSAIALRILNESDNRLESEQVKQLIDSVDTGSIAYSDLVESSDMVIENDVKHDEKITSVLDEIQDKNFGIADINYKELEQKQRELGNDLNEVIANSFRYLHKLLQDPNSDQNDIAKAREEFNNKLDYIRDTISKFEYVVNNPNKYNTLEVEKALSNLSVMNNILNTYLDRLNKTDRLLKGIQEAQETKDTTLLETTISSLITKIKGKFNQILDWVLSNKNRLMNLDKTIVNNIASDLSIISAELKTMSEGISSIIKSADSNPRGIVIGTFAGQNIVANSPFNYANENLGLFINIFNKKFNTKGDLKQELSKALKSIFTLTNKNQFQKDYFNNVFYTLFGDITIDRGNVNTLRSNANKTTDFTDNEINEILDKALNDPDKLNLIYASIMSVLQYINQSSSIATDVPSYISKSNRAITLNNSFTQLADIASDLMHLDIKDMDTLDGNKISSNVLKNEFGQLLLSIGSTILNHKVDDSNNNILGFKLNLTNYIDNIDKKTHIVMTIPLSEYDSNDPSMILKSVKEVQDRLEASRENKRDYAVSREPIKGINDKLLNKVGQDKRKVNTRVLSIFSKNLGVNSNNIEVLPNINDKVYSDVKRSRVNLFNNTDYYTRDSISSNYSLDIDKLNENDKLNVFNIFPIDKGDGTTGYFRITDKELLSNILKGNKGFSFNLNIIGDAAQTHSKFDEDFRAFSELLSIDLANQGIIDHNIFKDNEPFYMSFTKQSQGRVDPNGSRYNYRLNKSLRNLLVLDNTDMNTYVDTKDPKHKLSLFIALNEALGNEVADAVLVDNNIEYVFTHNNQEYLVKDLLDAILDDSNLDTMTLTSVNGVNNEFNIKDFFDYRIKQSNVNKSHGYGFNEITNLDSFYRLSQGENVTKGDFILSIDGNATGVFESQLHILQSDPKFASYMGILSQFSPEYKSAKDFIISSNETKKELDVYTNAINSLMDGLSSISRDNTFMRLLDYYQGKNLKVRDLGKKILLAPLYGSGERASINGLINELKVHFTTEVIEGFKIFNDSGATTINEFLANNDLNTLLSNRLLAVKGSELTDQDNLLVDSIVSYFNYLDNIERKTNQNMFGGDLSNTLKLIDDFLLSDLEHLIFVSTQVDFKSSKDFINSTNNKDFIYSKEWMNNFQDTYNKMTELKRIITGLGNNGYYIDNKTNTLNRYNSKTKKSTPYKLYNNNVRLSKDSLDYLQNVFKNKNTTELYKLGILNKQILGDNTYNIVMLASKDKNNDPISRALDSIRGSRNASENANAIFSNIKEEILKGINNKVVIEVAKAINSNPEYKESLDISDSKIITHTSDKNGYLQYVINSNNMNVISLISNDLNKLTHSKVSDLLFELEDIKLQLGSSNSFMSTMFKNNVSTEEQAKMVKMYKGEIYNSLRSKVSLNVTKEGKYYTAKVFSNSSVPVVFADVVPLINHSIEAEVGRLLIGNGVNVSVYDGYSGSVFNLLDNANYWNKGFEQSGKTKDFNLIQILDKIKSNGEKVIGNTIKLNNRSLSALDDLSNQVNKFYNFGVNNIVSLSSNKLSYGSFTEPKNIEKTYKAISRLYTGKDDTWNINLPKIFETNLYKNKDINIIDNNTSFYDIEPNEEINLTEVSNLVDIVDLREEENLNNIQNDIIIDTINTDLYKKDKLYIANLKGLKKSNIPTTQYLLSYLNNKLFNNVRLLEENYDNSLNLNEDITNKSTRDKIDYVRRLSNNTKILDYIYLSGILGNQNNIIKFNIDVKGQLGNLTNILSNNELTSEDKITQIRELRINHKNKLDQIRRTKPIQFGYTKPVSIEFDEDFYNNIEQHLEESSPLLEQYMMVNDNTSVNPNRLFDIRSWDNIINTIKRSDNKPETLAAIKKFKNAFFVAKDNKNSTFNSFEDMVLSNDNYLNSFVFNRFKSYIPTLGENVNVHNVNIDGKSLQLSNILIENIVYPSIVRYYNSDLIDIPNLVSNIVENDLVKLQNTLNRYNNINTIYIPKQSMKSINSNTSDTTSPDSDKRNQLGNRIDEDIEYTMFDEVDVSNIINQAKLDISKSNNTKYKEVSNKLLSFFNNMLNISKVYMSKDYNTSIKGQYDNANGILVLNKANLDNTTAYHELIHSATENALNSAYGDVQNIINSIDRIKNTVKASLDSNPDKLKELGITKDIYNSIFNDVSPSEFIAYFLSDERKFQYINNMKLYKSTIKNDLNLEGLSLGKKVIKISDAIVNLFFRGVSNIFTKREISKNLSLGEELANLTSNLSAFNKATKDTLVNTNADRSYVKAINKANSLFHRLTNGAIMTVDDYIKTYNLDEDKVKDEVMARRIQFLKGYNNMNNPFSKVAYIVLKGGYDFVIDPMSRKTYSEMIENIMITTDKALVKNLYDLYRDLRGYNKKSFGGIEHSLTQVNNVRTTLQRHLANSEKVHKDSINNLLEMYIPDIMDNLRDKDRSFVVNGNKHTLFYNHRLKPTDKFKHNLGSVINVFKLHDFLIYDKDNKIDEEQLQTILNMLVANKNSKIWNLRSNYLYDKDNGAINLLYKVMENGKGSKELNQAIHNGLKHLAMSRITGQYSSLGFINVEDMLVTVIDKYNKKTNQKIRLDYKSDEYKSMIKMFKRYITSEAIYQSETYDPKYHYDIANIKFSKNNIKWAFIDKNTGKLKENSTKLLKDLLINYRVLEDKNLKTILYNDEANKDLGNVQKRIKEYEQKGLDTSKLKELEKSIMENRLFSVTSDLDADNPYTAKYLDNRIANRYNNEVEMLSINFSLEDQLFRLKYGMEKSEMFNSLVNDLGYVTVDQLGLETEVPSKHNNKVMIFKKYGLFNKNETYSSYGKVEDDYYQRGFNLIDLYENGSSQYESIIKEAKRRKEYELNRLFSDTNSYKLLIGEYSANSEQFVQVGRNSNTYRIFPTRTFKDNVIDTGKEIDLVYAEMSKDTIKSMNYEINNTDIFESLMSANDYVRSLDRIKNLGLDLDNPKDEAELNRRGFVKLIDFENNSGDYQKYFSARDKDLFDKVYERYSYVNNKTYDRLWIPKEVIEGIFGFRDNLAKDIIDTLNISSKHKGSFTKFISKFDSVMKIASRESKDTTIVRNPGLTALDFTSNLATLSLLGVPAKDISSSIPAITDSLTTYLSDETERVKLEQELSLYTHKQTLDDEEIKTMKELESKLNTINARIRSNRVHKLASKGLWTNIAEDADETNSNTIDKFINEVVLASPKLGNMVQKGIISKDLNETIKKTVNELWLTNKSNLYQIMANWQRYTDFLPRQIVYEYYKDKLGYNDEDAFIEAQEIFVDYNSPIKSKILRNFDALGLAAFLKYYIRVHRTATKIFQKNPVGSIVLIGLANILGIKSGLSALLETFVFRGLPSTIATIFTLNRYRFIF